MKQPFGTTNNLAAGDTGYFPGTINLVRARTLSFTVRLTCGASLNADPEVDLFFSPDGQNWDSIPYTSFTMTFTASTTIQKTVIIDPPEHGYVRFAVVNKSSAGQLTNVVSWLSIQSWPPEPSMSRGAIDKDTLDG